MAYGGSGGGYPSHQPPPYGSSSSQGQYGGPPRQYGAAGAPYSHPPPPPPNLPAPWRAEWNQQENHYLYINTVTGQRTMAFPGARPPNAFGYHTGPPPPQGFAPPPQGYVAPPGHVPPQSQSGKHNWKDMAIGGAGGALLGGFLTHEWDEHKEHEKEDDWRRQEHREEDEIARLRRENAELERDDRDDRRREEELYAERRDYGGGGYGSGGGTTIIENNYVTDNDYSERDTYVEERTDYVDDSYRRDDYREDEYRRDDDYRGDDRRDQGFFSDIVDDTAAAIGRTEGRVERFGDGIEDSFDDGRDRERYDY